MPMKTLRLPVVLVWCEATLGRRDWLMRRSPLYSREQQETAIAAIKSNCDLDASYYARQVMNAMGLSYRLPAYLD